MKPRIWLVVLAAAVAACGGDSSSNGVVESADGLASLSFPEGSLPKGVSLDEISVEVVVVDDPEPGIPFMGVQLLPDGLVLLEPTMLTVVLPDGLEGGLMAIHQSDDSVEFLEGDLNRVDSETPTFEAPLTHFSRISFQSADDLFDVSLSVDREPVMEGETQTAKATITKKAGPISMWFSLESDPEGTLRLFQFSTPEPPISFFNTSIRYRSNVNVTYWDPPAKSVVITKTPTGWETSSGTFECIEENREETWFWPRAKFNLTLLSRGEPVSRDFPTFSRQLAGDSSADLPFSTNRADLRGISPGDTIQSVATLEGDRDTHCVASSGTTSSTTTTTTTSTSTSTSTTSSTSTTLALGTTTTTTPGTTTTTTPGTTTTTAPGTTTTAPSQGTSKKVSVNLPCPQPVGGQSWIDVNIPADAINPTHVVSPSPWGCPNTEVSLSGQVTSPGVYRVSFTATGGSGAPGETVSTTVTVNWTNP